MPTEHLTFPIPDRCPNCNAAGTVQLQQNIRGQAVLLSWWCTHCHAESPIPEQREVSRAMPRKPY